MTDHDGPCSVLDMTNTDAVTILGARTQPQAVEDRLAEMTDGSFEVVAFEVFDHPDAIPGGADVSEGEVRGVWILGRRADVEALVQARFYEYEESFSRGADAPAEQVVEIEFTVALKVNVAAWQLAYGDQGGPAGLAEDVRTYVENLFHSCSQRPARLGGEDGILDVEVDHS